MKHLNIQIITKNGSCFKNLTISLKVLILSCSLLLVAAFFIITTGSYAINKLLLNPENKNLDAENKILLSKFNYLSAELELLKSGLEEIENTDTKIRTLLGLKEIDTDVRAVGVGGYYTDTLNEKNNLLNSLENNNIEKISSSIERLNREIKLQDNSFQQILRNYSDKKDLWDHTPSLLPVNGWISGHFGHRIDPFTGRKTIHEGLDISCPVGSPVHASADGTVTFSAKEPDYGWTVKIKHNYGYETSYSHNAVNKVKVGQMIKRGEVIALAGQSGRTTGPHVHYELSINGNKVNPLANVLPEVCVD